MSAERRQAAMDFGITVAVERFVEETVEILGQVPEPLDSDERWVLASTVVLLIQTGLYAHMREMDQLDDDDG